MSSPEFRTSSAAKPGLNIIEGIYGRDGDGFGVGEDSLANLVMFGKDRFRLDMIGMYLGGHEPGNVNASCTTARHDCACHFDDDPRSLRGNRDTRFGQPMADPRKYCWRASPNLRALVHSFVRAWPALTALGRPALRWSSEIGRALGLRL